MSSPRDIKSVSDWTKVIVIDRSILALVATVAWIANYLHFAQFGLYEDDWYYVGFPFVVGFKTWMFRSLPDVLFHVKAQGRPLQMILGYLFAGMGELAQSLRLDYIIAYCLFVGSAFLAYSIMKQRLSRLTAALATLVFVLTPLDTLHQFLNGQFTFGPAFMFAFGAILLYIRQRKVAAYFVAVMSLLSYESIFFLFLGAPLLTGERLVRGRGREWISHLSIGSAMVGCYFFVRLLLAEQRVKSLPHGMTLLWNVGYNWLVNIGASFFTYAHAVARIPDANREAWVWGLLFFCASFFCLLWLLKNRLFDCIISASTKVASTRTELGIGLAFLVLGYPLSYFFFESPTRFYMTDRGSRVSCAASFGSSILFAALLSAILRSARTRLSRVCGVIAVTVSLTAMFVYSFVIQNDYIRTWADEREQARQIVELTPDLQPDSVIIVKSTSFFDPSAIFASGSRGIGLENYIYEQEFPWMCAAGGKW